MNKINAYFSLDFLPEKFSSYVQAESISCNEIIRGLYLLEDITEDQYIDLKLRFNISSTWIKKDANNG